MSDGLLNSPKTLIGLTRSTLFSEFDGPESFHKIRVVSVLEVTASKSDVHAHGSGVTSSGEVSSRSTNEQRSFYGDCYNVRP